MIEKKVDVFPKWKFHQDEPEGKIFNSLSDFKNAGDGWEDSPLAFFVAPMEETKEETKEEAKEAPLEVKKKSRSPLKKKV